MADIPEAETSDMSIDELSAAIDEHMKGVASAPEKTKKSSTPEKTPEPEIKVETKPVEKPAEVSEPKKEDETKEVNTKSSRIEVRKSGYLSNEDGVSKNNQTVPEEPDGRIATGNRSMNPIDHEASDPTEPIDETTDSTPVKNTKPARTSMVDVVVKQSPSPKPAEPAPAPIEAPKEADKEPVEEEVVAIKEEEPIETEPEKAKEVESSPEEEPTEEETKPEPTPPPPPKRSNDIEELTAQIGEKEEEVNTPSKSDTLKTFDTKLYHIPIKPSHHHRAGSSFMVFAAVLAGILAILFVLNELEIIDIAALVYTN